MNRLILFLLTSLTTLTINAKVIIKTSSVYPWAPSSLSQIINECKDDCVIVFDADYDYTIDRCITPKVSVEIRGCGKKLRTINKYNFVISLFDVRGVDYFKINNLILDGSSDYAKPDNTKPKEFFITVKDVKDVSFTKCTFQNIRTDYPNWKPGDEPYTIWVENYKKFIFCDNIVRNCDCPEFLKAVLPKNNQDANRIAKISRNNMQFYRTSSAIEVRFGRFQINNNEIGVTHGSTINAFGFDSEIIGNILHGSHNSSSIDISEQFAFKYVSSNIIVKNNYSEYAHDGFFMADHVNGIIIKNNTYRADIFDENEHERYDKVWTKVERKCDLALRLDHDISDINIVSNKFIGCNALMMLATLGRKANIRIEKNYIKNIPTTKRSSLLLSQIDGMTVKDNIFINAGRTFSYMNEQQFIVIGPTETMNTSERYVRNLIISKNSFSFSDSRTDSAYVLAHTIYDKANCNTLSSLENITIKNNTTSFRGDVLLVTDNFVDPTNATIIIKRNKFNSGLILGNIVKPQSVRQVKRATRLESNAIVEKNGIRYYVVFGGITSSTDVDYNRAGYIKDGNVILRKF